MKNPFPWQCDKCNRHKEATNHWLIGKLVTDTAQHLVEFRIGEWTEEEAEQPTSVHLCGLECAQRWASEQLGKLLGVS